MKPIIKSNNVKILESQLFHDFTSSLSGVERIYAFHGQLLGEIERTLSNWGPNSMLGALFKQMVMQFNSIQSKNKIISNQFFLIFIKKQF